MNDRVQPDSNSSSFVQAAGGSPAGAARSLSMDALFAQAMAAVSARIAPPGLTAPGGLPTPASTSTATGRVEGRKRAGEPGSRERHRPNAEAGAAEQGVIIDNVPMTAAQHARRELRGASNSGAVQIECRGEPAEDSGLDSGVASGKRAADQPISSPRVESHGDERDPDAATPTRGVGSPPDATRSPAHSGPTHRAPAVGDSSSGATPAASPGAVGDGAATSAASGEAISVGTIAASGATTDGKPGGPSEQGSARADPIAALGALGARGTRARLTTELLENRAPTRAASLPDQVARGLATLLRHQGGSVTIRLTPESLGQIKINLKIEDSRVWATFQPSSDSSRAAIDQSLGTLRTSLEARGLVVERLELTPSGMTHFEQSLRDPWHRGPSSESGTPSQTDPNASGSHDGGQADGRREAPGHDPAGGAMGPARGAGDDGVPGDDPHASRAMFVEESPSGVGLARRLRLDAVA